jgi:MOSC domain-containing protein YiiM
MQLPIASEIDVVGTLISVQVGQVANLEIPSRSSSGRSQYVTSAIHKSSVTGAVMVAPLGLQGDAQANLAVHGGIDKAILAYCYEHYSYWTERLNRSFLNGAFGENLTVSGLNEQNVCIGDQFAVGTTILEVSQPRQPCFKLAAYWKEPQIVKWVIQNGHCGWYFRVLRAGSISAGDQIVLTSRPNPDWSLSRANNLMYEVEIDAQAIQELYLLPQLSLAWKKDLG